MVSDPHGTTAEQGEITWLDGNEQLRLEALNRSRDRRPGADGVGNRAYLRNGQDTRKIQSGSPDDGICRGIWRGRRRTGQTAGLHQAGVERDSRKSPCGLKHPPDGFAIRAIGKPSRQHIVIHVLPDEESPTRIIGIPPVS